MNRTVGWLALLAGIAGILDQTAWLAADTWFAGWIGVLLALVAAGMVFFGK